MVGSAGQPITVLVKLSHELPCSANSYVHRESCSIRQFELYAFYRTYRRRCSLRVSWSRDKNYAVPALMVDISFLPPVCAITNERHWRGLGDLRARCFRGSLIYDAAACGC